MHGRLSVLALTALACFAAPGGPTLATEPATTLSDRLPPLFADREQLVLQESEPLPPPDEPDTTCPPLGEVHRYLPPLDRVGIDIDPAAGEFPPDCGEDYFDSLPYDGLLMAHRGWGLSTFHWTASGLWHRPLYFEDVPLERYGHTICPLVQPALSAAHFFATVPVLPYKMGLEPCCEHIYALGYYRPSSCAPRLCYPVPLRLDAAALEAGAITGLIFLIP